MARSRSLKYGVMVGIAGVTVVILLLAVSGFFESQASIPDENLVTVERQALALSVVATGAIVPATTVELKSKAAGLVKTLPVDEGNAIVPGQVLIELDKELLQAQVRETEANRQAVVARLEELQSETDSAQSMKRKMELDLENLHDKLAYHQKQIDRYQALYRENLIPHSDLETREREFQDTSFQLQALKSELIMQDSRIEASRKAVARGRAEVLQADAVLERARENLRYATITSPISGTVLKRHVEVGDAVSSILQLGSQATLLMTLGDMEALYVKGRVDEADIGRVYKDQKALVTVDAFRDRKFPGHVTEIAPLGQEKDNVIGFEVKVSIQDPERILRAQMSANAEIILEEKEGVLVIPESAVIYDRNRKTFADLYDPSAESLKRRVPIEVGISNGTQTEIVSGLSEGDQVVKPGAGGLI